jgi:quercetin dioxygenase-like cupin family protein
MVTDLIYQEARTMNATALPLIVAPGQGEPIWHLGSLVEVVLEGAQTGGILALIVTEGPRGMASPPHVHTREEETFLVLDGEVAFTIDGATTVAGPGTAVYAPRGIPHHFEVVSERARFHNLITPAGFEEFFRELSEPAPRREVPPPGEGMSGIGRVREVCARFGVEVLV